MPEPTHRVTMRTLIDPPLDTWRLGPVDGTGRGADRDALQALVRRFSPSAAAAAFDASRPILATGHQAWLWHPGILAKDIATVSAAHRLGATPLHLVVDHDVGDPLTVELPVRRDDALDVETVRLGSANPAVPTGAQPPVDADRAMQELIDARRRLGDALQADVGLLIEAIGDSRAQRFESLAQQIGAWTVALMRPSCGDVPLAPTSALLHTDAGEALLDAMLANARQCVRCYNEAVAAHPDAGVPPLLVERERVELPIWSLHWGRPRQRVFADLADATPLLTFEDGTAVPDATGDGRTVCWLAPRALLLTALMRSRFCAMFVHGKGGGIYDRATDQWWQTWRGESLAPATVVSADVWLPLDAPVAERGDVMRAQWYRHYAPFNIDRLLHLDGPLTAQKQRLLRELTGLPRRGRRWQRWLAFREIHRINVALSAAHPDVVRDAERRLVAAHQGLANARLAHRRDWCFALYPPAVINELRQTIDRSAIQRPQADAPAKHRA